MLEVFFLRWFFKRLAEVAENKGRSKAWAGLGVALWFAAEIIGIGIGFASGGGELPAYGFGIGLAIVSAIVSYGIVASLPDAREAETAPLQF